MYDDIGVSEVKVINARHRAPNALTHRDHTSTLLLLNTDACFDLWQTTMSLQIVWFADATLSSAHKSLPQIYLIFNQTEFMVDHFANIRK